MKKIKSLLLIACCFALLIVTSNITTDYEIEPCDHHEQSSTKK